MKTKYWVLPILIALAAGFFIGRATIEKDEKFRHVKGETVYGRLDPDFLTVKYEFKSDIKFLPRYLWKADTINKVEHIIPDTAKIIEDFLTERKYDIRVFDNENGRLDVQPTLQYNRIQSFSYSFTPIHKLIPSKEKVFVPFVSGSYNSFGIAGIGGGLFYHNIGLEYKYLYQLPANLRGHEVGMKVKF